MERLATLYIDKEAHKFSAAHYTIFSATERERLHGHNFSVSAMIAAPMGENGFAADYNVYKGRIKTLCDALDEYLILPANSPHQQVEEDGECYRVTFDGRRCVFCAARLGCCRSSIPRSRSLRITCCGNCWTRRPAKRWPRYSYASLPAPDRKAAPAGVQWTRRWPDCLNDRTFFPLLGILRPR
jgi:6-pyruvoyl-tetrahydropterin synthase